MIALEYDCSWEVTSDMAMRGLSCDGCELGFMDANLVAAMVDRYSHRSYIIHTTCETVLYAKLQGEADA